MKTTMVLQTSFLFIIFAVGLSLGDNLEECIIQETCHTRNGISRTAYCLQLMPQKEFDIYWDILLTFHPNATDIEDMIKIFCQDMQKTKEVSLNF
ncbi:hypothetical protein AVEN_57554-1 [Araneus ventricosus]|uniref:Saposin B-type domain-containing protein n=1 Tax=Araneus ventricosus TaxID=182803 RepID=A0A4Y2TV64_ARAVE|nr:hypothetical protein AVEN_57554-1 [Araneus ventricosus]